MTAPPASTVRVDGTYVRRTPESGEAGFRSQVALQGLARESAREVGETGRRLFVPILREPSRNGSDGKQKKKVVGARRGPRGPGRHPSRKKAIDEA